MRDLLHDAVRDMKTARACLGEKNRFLITAPHAANIRNPLDDPCTADIAWMLDTLLRQSNFPCRTIVANVSRQHGDQNRLHTLEHLNDVSALLLEYADERGRDWGDVIHVDVHSYTFTDSDIPPKWGRGVNILHLKGDEIQREFAFRVAKRMDTYLNGVIPPCTVVEHDRLPTHIKDDDSNAMIELSRHLGALSLLIEFPTNLGEDGEWYTRGSTHFLAEGLASSLCLEAKHPLKREVGQLPRRASSSGRRVRGGRR